MRLIKFWLPLAGWLTGLALLVRLISLALYPLMDTTEARYGEIARIMAETGNWITPFIDYQQPFWGKPPLYSWLTASSFTLFGVSEFSARLPHFLVGLIILWLVWRLAKWQSNQHTALLAALVLSTTLVFLVSIGAVMTDTVLLLSTTLILCAFWYAMHPPTDQQHRYWAGLWLFVGVAIGLLAKGPIAPILAGLPIFVWCVIRKQFLTLWRRVPWIYGLLLACALSLPWYLLAEQATPGFLEYFLVGEHWLRFTVEGWEGDLYGTAHIQPKGMIWLMWLYAAMPWSIVVLVLAVREKRQQAKQNPPPQEATALDKQRAWRLFLWLWMLTPMVFFTLAGNILWTYVLPATPALALLTASYLRPLQAPAAKQHTQALPRWLIGCAMVTPLFVVSFTLASHYGHLKNSARDIIARYRIDAGQADAPLFFWMKQPHSGQFYSAGKAQLISNLEELNQLLATPFDQPIYLISSGRANQHLPPEVRAQLICVEGLRAYCLWKKVPE